MPDFDPSCNCLVIRCQNRHYARAVIDTAIDAGCRKNSLDYIYLYAEMLMIRRSAAMLVTWQPDKEYTPPDPHTTIDATDLDKLAEWLAWKPEAEGRRVNLHHGVASITDEQVTIEPPDTKLLPGDYIAIADAIRHHHHPHRTRRSYQVKTIDLCRRVCMIHGIEPTERQLNAMMDLATHLIGDIGETMAARDQARMSLDRVTNAAIAKLMRHGAEPTVVRTGQGEYARDWTPGSEGAL